MITSPKPIRVIPRGKPIKKIIVFRLNREAPPKGAGKAPQGKNVYDHGLVFFLSAYFWSRWPGGGLFFVSAYRINVFINVSDALLQLLMLLN